MTPRTGMEDGVRRSTSDRRSRHLQSTTGEQLRGGSAVEKCRLVVAVEERRLLLGDGAPQPVAAVRAAGSSRPSYASS